MSGPGYPRPAADGVCDYCQAAGERYPGEAVAGRLPGQPEIMGPETCAYHVQILDDTSFDPAKAWDTVDAIAWDTTVTTADEWPMGTIVVAVAGAGMVTGHGPDLVRVLCPGAGETWYRTGELARVPVAPSAVSS